MGLSARVPANLVTYKLIPEIWGKKLAEAVHNNLVCWPLIDTETVAELKKGDIFYIPKSNTVSATEVIVGSASTAGNPLNTAAVTLTINKWYDVRIPIDDMSMRQSQVNMQAIALREASYALRKQIDTSVNTLYSAFNGGTRLGTDGVAISDDVLIEAWETLSKNDVPEEDRALVVNPSAIADFMKEDKLVSQMYGTKGPVTAGFKGFHKVYGCPVFLTNNLTNATTGAYAAMFHKNALAGKIQENLEVELYDIPTEHQVNVLVTALWGVIEVRNTFGVPIYTRSR